MAADFSLNRQRRLYFGIGLCDWLAMDCPFHATLAAMTNNNILKKITIANNLKHFEVKEIFELGGFPFSSSLIKGFMAGSKNKNYEKLSDQHFEGFLNGFIIYSRGSVDDSFPLPRTIENHIISLIEADNQTALDEIRSLIKMPTTK